MINQAGWNVSDFGWSRLNGHCEINHLCTCLGIKTDSRYNPCSRMLVLNTVEVDVLMLKDSTILDLLLTVIESMMLEKKSKQRGLVHSLGNV